MKHLLLLFLLPTIAAQNPNGEQPRPQPVPVKAEVQQQKATQNPAPKPEPKPEKAGQGTSGQGATGQAGQGQAGQGQAGQGQAAQGTGGPDAGKKPVVKPVEKPVEEAVEEPRIDRPAEDAPMPRGSDPADIAAMRGAEAMLAAERKLAEQIRSGKITGLDKILPFDELTSWVYEDALKGMPKRIKELSGKKVLMTGFMLPIDEVQNIKEFLLVQSLWACCYGQPPDIHGIVRVVMPKGKTTDYFFDPIKVTGTFKVEATVMDGYCVDIYQLHVESLEALPYK